MNKKAKSELDKKYPDGKHLAAITTLTLKYYSPERMKTFEKLFFKKSKKDANENPK